MVRAVCEQGGFTVALRAVGSRAPAVRRLQSGVAGAGALGASPGTNLYLTPPGDGLRARCAASHGTHGPP